MSPKTAVIIPWASTCPHRISAVDYVMHWYRTNFPDWQVILGISAEGDQWCKARAVADGIRRTDAELLVISDADCFAPRLPEAVEAVVSGTRSWAMPHYTVHRLTQEATRRVIDEEVQPADLSRTVEHYAQMPYSGYPGGGIVVLRRGTYAKAPLDPRFVGWGQEDECWAIALRSLYGPPFRPATGPLWHLWHPPQKRISRAVGSENSRNLRTQYRIAARTGRIEINLREARRLAATALGTVSGEM